jgi:hypothetical protein
MTPTREPGDGSCYVIVPAVMGVGLLLSLLTLARDHVGRLRGHQARARRVRTYAHAAAVAALEGTDAARRDVTPLRGRTHTAATAVLVLAFAVYLVPGATWNFFNPVNLMRGIAWLWALTLSVVVVTGAVGLTLAAAALRWSDLPAAARPLLLRTSLTAAPVDTPPAPAPHATRGRPAATGGRRFRLSARTAARLRLTATLWLGVVVAVLGVLLWTRGMPRTPESGVVLRAVEVPLQASLLALLVVGQLVALRWHRTGAVVVAASGSLLGYLASVQYRPVVSAAVAGAALLPAFLLWLAWQRTARLRTVVELAVVTTLVLVVVVVAADRTWSSYFGPSHPASSAPAPSRELVDWMWAGAVTDSSMDVRVRTRREARDVRLLVSPADGPAGPVAAGRAAPVSSDPQLFAAGVSGLRPDTRYTWTVEVDGRTDPARTGHVRTFPRGPSSFTFAVGSCALTGSNGAVFDAVRRADPLFFAIAGDYLYANIETDDVGRFHDAYDASLRAPAQAALFARTPVTYVWDDHDYSGNDGDGTATSRPAALRAYRDAVPHYPLRFGEDGPLFQAFTVGRVRVIVTDNRSARTPAEVADGPGKSMLGDQQRDALLAELGAAGRWAAVVWVNPSPWVAEERAGADDWGGYATERRVIADTIAAAGVDNLVMVSGDAHMLALDDGTNTDFSATGGGGFPLLHAAALDRPGGVKGGPYSGPVVPGGGQFGTVAVHDDGASVRLTLSGWDWRGERVMTSTVEVAAR